MKKVTPPVTGEQNTELHTKENITSEIKVALKDFIKGMNADLIGRPLYVIVIGDNGMEVSNTSGNTFSDEDNIDILTSCLKDLTTSYPNL